MKPARTTAVLLTLAIVACAATAHAAASAATRFENPVIRVDVTGSGKPMVLIPGLTCGGDVWNETVAHYASRYQCHVVTLGGFAGRPRFEGPFLDQARDSLLSYLRLRGLKQPVIVGHSLGGVLAIELAAAAPDAIGPIVIVDALPFLGGAGDSTATAESAKKMMEPMWTMMRGHTQEAYTAFQKNAPYLKSMVAPGPNYDRVLEWATTSDRIAVADAMYDLTGRDLRSRLPGVRSPVLVLGSWYGMKEYTTREGVEATFRRQYAGTPHWTLALADTARHFIMLDSPEWTFAQMDEFLARPGSKAGATTSAR
jgi:pimeloyl-ACP methyl ester carboxylesterase